MRKRPPRPILLAVLCAGFGHAAGGQGGGGTEPPARPAPPARVLLLGTFHFRDAGLDNYKPVHDVDALSPRRQDEIEELVRCLGAYRPTRIGVEAREDSRDRLRRELTAYRAGDFELPSDELYQLGFRLAVARELDELEPIDVAGRWYDPYVDPDEWAAAHGQEATLQASEAPWEGYYTALYTWRDRIKTERTLREHLLDINREEALLESHGHYLIGSFKAGRGDEYPGVDAKIGWYSRNLRIFANLLRVIAGPDDRLLVIIGSGHVPILRHAVRASPQVELVEVGAYLEDGCGDP